jgi:hypothetical protein
MEGTAAEMEAASAEMEATVAETETTAADTDAKAAERGSDVAHDASEHGFEVIPPSGDALNDGSTEGDATGPNEDGLQPSSKRLYESIGANGYTDWVEEMPEELKNPVPDTESSNKGFALLLRTQVINRKQKLHSIVIQSPLLREALRGVLASYPGIHLASDPLVFEAPFKPFVHRWQQLVDACENHEQQNSRQHLCLLKSALEPELKEAFAMIKNFAEHGVIEYRYLWAVFAPGSIAISERGKVVHACKVLKTAYKKQDDEYYFFIHGYSVDWNGKIFGRALQVLAIPEFEGSADRLELSTLPLEYLPDKESTKEMLVERGRLFASVAGVFYKAYDGVGIDKFSIRSTAYHVTGRVVIDASKKKLIHRLHSPEIVNVL